jgi:hypothetical protein
MCSGVDMMLYAGIQGMYQSMHDKTCARACMYIHVGSIDMRAKSSCAYQQNAGWSI